ncbi:HAD domain-containing protein [Kitasatospora sp. NPDC002227]|uniref:HAD domain-containing protein n=1 Tax=Kitasatospora sp. NPDC002227 TaxID=3154773 RepID=UPI003318DBCC
MRPLLYLDVDGVLNPDHPTPECTTHRILDLDVHLSARHAAWLQELAGTYDLTWATTWEDHANTHLSPSPETRASPSWT